MSIGYIVEQRDDTGTYHRWDMNKWVEYRRARNFTQKDHPTVNHPFLGKSFIRSNKDKITITNIVKHWHGGFYLYAIFEVNDSGSHGSTVIENINCIDEIILHSLVEFQKDFKLIY